MADPSTFTFDRRLKYALSGIAAGVFIVLALMRGTDLISRKEQILNNREKHAANLAAILSRYLHEVFAGTDSSLRQLSMISRRIGGPSAPPEEWGPVLRSAKAGLSGVGSISVVDTEGIIRHATIDFIIGQSRRTDYVFQRLHSESKDILVASKPFRTLTKNPQLVIPLGRRLTTQDGTFDGAVVATVVPIELQRFFQSVDVGKSGILWVFHPDGIILIQEPSQSNPMGRTAQGNSIYEAARRGREAGTLRGAITTGGPVMLNAFRATAEPKLFVAISLNQDEALSEWWREVVISIVAFLLFGLFVTLILIYLFRQIVARSLAEHVFNRNH
ncbi:hypothetical protein L0222_22700 [bacterium]|nr:hypothetical protein [bacterium]